MTQSAVSKQVQGIEERLGIVLFKRTPTGLRTTYAGALYMEKITAALRLIDEADALVAHPDARVNLNIAVSPSFAQYCLIPRLPEFLDQHPGIRINVRPRLVTGRDRSERFDAEIQLNTGHAAGMTAQYLCGREMGLVAAPSLLRRHRVNRVEDLDSVRMLKRAQRGYSWDEWLAEVAPGHPPPGAHAPEYEGFSLLLPSVLHGLGVAIVPLCLVKLQLSSGALRRPLGEVVEGRYAYYLMQPRPSQSGPQLEEFCNWLIDMAAGLRIPPSV
ncbi:DNA-binding transcriptional regulator, LysR family [Variovorax sp. OK212]|nr:DNA-binding transcriptional regulator, LysR family [Variovorax sp. OK202]SFC51008.1 DNA-binding transcriptional regulator, LysR family [Variovorax sp. OK212]